MNNLIKSILSKMKDGDNMKIVFSGLENGEREYKMITYRQVRYLERYVRVSIAQGYVYGYYDRIAVKDIENNFYRNIISVNNIILI